MFKKIKTFFRTRRHKKELAKIHNTLLSNPKILLQEKVKFELAFGANQINRTAKQWGNLVRVYSLEKVCEMEKMSEGEVKKKCIETFKQRISKLN